MDSPSRRTEATCAWSAMYARSARTGPSNQRTRSTAMPAASAISSTVSPARIRAWISLGRNGLSTSISYCASREVWPRATALSRSSIGNMNRSLRPGMARTAYRPSSLTATKRSSCIVVPSVPTLKAPPRPARSVPPPSVAGAFPAYSSPAASVETGGLLHLHESVGSYPPRPAPRPACPELIPVSRPMRPRSTRPAGSAGMRRGRLGGRARLGGRRGRRARLLVGPAHLGGPPVPPAEQHDRARHQDGADDERVHQDAQGQSDTHVDDLAAAGLAPADQRDHRERPGQHEPSRGHRGAGSAQCVADCLA